MRHEVEAADSIFDLPVRKWFVPESDLDLSATHFGRKAGTPVGPAAGPHTQLAQNIVLAWLAGGRIIELKTVQANDTLTIPRPCIHAPNLGFNVEWSQELSVGESLLEYAKAAFLIEVLKSTRAFGRFPREDGLETVFDISVGYDLEGIRSEKVVSFLRGLQNPTVLMDSLRDQLPGDLAEFRDLDLPCPISECVTLSTFHGCPAHQIEAIARFLMDELGLHVIIKLNPTLLGFDEVRHLIHDRLGYLHLRLRQDAFDMDLQLGDAMKIMRNLRGDGDRSKPMVGAKFTNTLVVENDPDIFPTQADPFMYLSGPPLHVISMTLMQRFRESLEFEFPVSFSAGIDAKNFPRAVACGMVPVTTCTDLLKQGGYGRLPSYLRGLGREMGKLGVSTREAYVLAAGGNGPAAVKEALVCRSGGEDVWRAHEARFTALATSDPDAFPDAVREAATAGGLPGDEVVREATSIAGRLNGRRIVAALPDEERYHASSVLKIPKKVDSRLDLYDCLNCDLCVSACPNDAIFVYRPGPVEVETMRLKGTRGGGFESEEGAGFKIATDHQLAVFQGACNECSNCEVYCPEEGAPFRRKERIFPDLRAFRASGWDGFVKSGGTMDARLGGRELSLVVHSEENRAVLGADWGALELEWDSLWVVEARFEEPGLSFDTALLWRLKTVWEAIYSSPTPNPVCPGFWKDEAGSTR
jgi:putative selenate reductase